MKKDIYLITNLVNGKQYVGQTNSFEGRWSRYLSDAKRDAPRQLISKAIKKYGKENFEIEILESQVDDYDEKEREWIKDLDTIAPKGYNVSYGGQGVGAGIEHPSSIFKSKEELEKVINDIKNTNITFEKLGIKYGCTPITISDINRGKYYYDSTLSYPLRVTRYTKEKIKQIKYSLKYELDKTMKDIAEEYEVDLSQVNEINQGRLHPYPNEVHPLRDGKMNTKARDYVDEIIDLLKNTDIPQKDIAVKFNISANAVSGINKGRNFYREGETYPIRQNYQGNRGGRRTFSPDEIREIEKDLLEGSDSMRTIAQKYEVGLTTILNINIGSVIKYKNPKLDYPLRKR